MADFSHLGGWINRPDEVEKVVKSSKFPYFGDIAHMKYTGRDTQALLHKLVIDIIGYYPVFTQEIGDCLNPSAMVRMSDGSEKRIIDINEGEYVITPFGNVKKIIRKIVKPYDKSMVKIHTKGYRRYLETTPDHLLINYPNIGRYKRKISQKDKNYFEWKPCISFNEGDYLLVPKLPNYEDNTIFDLVDIVDGCITHDVDFDTLRLEPVEKGKIRLKGSPKSINRYIKLDEKLCWLIGLYAAEGGCSISKNGNTCYKVTFSLSYDEYHIAIQVKQYIEEIFGTEAKVHQIPSKPTVLFVDVTNVIVATFFKYLCSGNTYTKSLNSKLLITSYKNKLQLLLGWLIGDGCKYNHGVSVCKNLIYQFFDIANSLGINSSILYRKAYKQSKEAYVLQSRDSIALQESVTTGILKLKNKSKIELGKAVKIDSIEIVEPESNYVYCLEVEDDHSFIANGYAVHNCVSHAAAGGATALQAIEVAIEQDEEFGGIIATEPIYHDSRVLIGGGSLGNSDGSVMAWAVAGMQKYGTLVRKNYPELGIDLTKYSGQRAKQYGAPNSKLPEGLYDISRKHPVRLFSKVTNSDQVLDALASGYPIVFGAQFGVNGTRDKHGIAKRGPNWSHAQYIIASDPKYTIPSCLICNSWGAWNSGPKRYPEDPDGSYWSPLDDIDYICRQGDAFAISSFQGFELRDLNLRIV